MNKRIESVYDTESLYTGVTSVPVLRGGGETLDVFQEGNDRIHYGCYLRGDIWTATRLERKGSANSVSVVFENIRAEILYLSLWKKLPFPRSWRWSQAIKTLDAAINNMITGRKRLSTSFPQSGAQA
jgi:hypothetical protein